MSELIDDIARAIDPVAWSVPEEDYPAERSRREARQSSAKSTALRVLKAMMVATDEMLEAGSVVRDPLASRIDNTKSTWEAMIEEALK